MKRKSKIVCQELRSNFGYWVVKLINRLEPQIHTIVKKEELIAIMNNPNEDVTIEILPEPE